MGYEEKEETKKKKMKKFKFWKIQVNMTNRVFYTFIAIGIMILLGVVVYAFTPWDNAKTVWHNADDVKVTIDSQDTSLQDAINDGGLGGTDTRCDVAGTCSQVCIGDDCQSDWSGAIPGENTITRAMIIDIAPGEHIYRSFDGTVTKRTTPTWVEFRSLTIPQDGTYRVYFEYMGVPSGGGHYTDFQIFKNGVAVGTKYRPPVTDWTKVWYKSSQDLSGWKMGDKCQIYVRYYNAWTTASVSNFRLYVDANTLFFP